LEKYSKHKFFIKLHRRSILWIVLALITILLSDILSTAFIDRWYYQGVFEWIRVTYDAILGWSPLPMIYLLVAIVIVRIFFWIRERKKGFLFLLSKALGGIAFLIFLFYFLWGFNYSQVPLQARLGLDLKKVTQEDIEVEFLRATQELETAVKSLPSSLTSDESIRDYKISDNDLRKDVEKALRDLGIPDRGKVRVRQLWPPGFLLRWSTAGIYIPQAFEGHIDKGLLSVQKPFTIAHEMAHGYGVTDEGACNFVAWLACRQSDNPWIRFGGTFTYWRYAASEMPENGRDVLHTSDENRDGFNTSLPFPPVVIRSLALIRENDKKYPDILPKIRDAIYSNYLKRHGVVGGLRSYDYVVMMVVEYLGKKG